MATGALKPAGILTLIHREDRLEEIVLQLIRLGCGNIALKRLSPANRVLLRAQHGRERTIVEAAPLELHRADGSGYTEAAEAILRHGAPLDF